jgi:Photosynthetic reaction centre cytochrome C subunit
VPRPHFTLGRIPTFFLIAGLLTLVAGRAGSHAQQPPVPAPQAPAQAQGGGRGGPRNIQVLKDVPQDQILLTMQYISASLGVQCNYCHVQGQNDLDDKEPKKIAREMMKMVDKVNATFFDGKPRVSCASCHNGRATPVRTPPLAVEMTAEQAAAFARGRGGRGGPRGGPGGPGRGAEPPSPPVPTETVDQILERYVQALGGPHLVQSAKTRVMTGTLTSRESPMTSSPGRRRSSSAGFLLTHQRSA